MKPAPKLILIFMLMAVGIAWMIMRHSMRSPPASNQSPKFSETASATSPQAGSNKNIKSFSQRIAEYSKQTDDFNKKMVGHHAKIADQMGRVDVSEHRKKIAERMKRNESFLQPLLDEWNLTEDQTKTVFDTLHQRADMMFDALHESALNTPKDAGDRSDSNRVKARVEKTQANLDAAKLLGESILLPLLGRERYELLNQREKEIENKFRKKRDDD